MQAQATIPRSAGPRSSRCRPVLVVLAALLAVVPAPASAQSGCGALPTDVAVGAVGDLSLDKDITVNGTGVPDGQQPAGTAVLPDGTLGSTPAQLPALDPPTFPPNGSGTNVDHGDSPFVSGGEVFYQELVVGEGQTVTFSGGGPFHIDKLTVDKDARLVFGEGTYFIREMVVSKDVIVDTDGGTAVVHVGEKMDMDKDVTVNASGSVSQFQVYLHRDATVDIDKDLDFTGLIYGPESGDISIDKDAGIRGIVIGGKDVSIGKDANLTLDGGDLSDLDDVSTCSEAGVHHFAIDHDRTGINCQAEPVTITAHAADDSPEQTYTGTVTLSTSTGHGDWSLAAGAGTLANSGNGVATYTFDAADSGTVTLALRDTFVETVDIGVTGDGVSESAAEDPALNFQRSGFNVLAQGLPDAVGTQIAGKSSLSAPGGQLLELQAVTTNSGTGACEAALQGPVSVELAYECLDPGTCGTLPLVLGGAALPGNPAGGVVAYTGVDLDFGDAGDSTAPFSLIYPDVGRIRLHARFQLRAEDGSITGESMVGGSNAFVVRPFGFALDFGGDRAANGVLGTSYAADAAGSRFEKAGAAFPVSLTAVAWQAGDDADANGQPDPGASLFNNAVTPAFGREAMAPTVDLTHTLVAPAGGSSGTLGGGSGIGGFVAGVATGSISWSEVGIIDLAASHGDYLGAGVPVTGVAIGVGRFYPARLRVSDNGPSLRNGVDAGWACGFTYMDQPFAFDVNPVITVVAENATGQVTNNYGGDFWKFGPSPYLAGRSYASTATSSAALDAPALGTVTLAGEGSLDGQGTLTIDGEEFAYLRQASVEGPFDAEITLTLPAGDLTDTDGVCNHATAATCNTADGDAGQAHAVAAIGGANLRFGRLGFRNALGSELLPLPLPLRAQYFDGNGFVTNASDGCTSLPTAALDLANDSEDPAPGVLSIVLGSGATTLTLTGIPLAGGDAGAGFSSPGAGNTGHVDVFIDLSAGTGADMEWLRFDWDGDGTHDDDPTARATFGLYGGSPLLIFKGEPWR